MSDTACTTKRSYHQLEVESHLVFQGFEESRLGYEANHICREAIFLLSWAILLQKYRAQQDVCFAWFPLEAAELSVWHQGEAVTTTVAIALRNITKRIREINENKTADVDEAVNAAIFFDEIGSEASLQFDLELHVRGSNVSLRTAESFATDQVQAIGNTLNHIITSITSDWSATLESIVVLSPQDRALISSWNADSPKAIDCCLHDILERQACLTPYAEAVCSWDGSMTYKALSETSTRLGHYLVHHAGIEVEQPTGFAFEKSLDAIVTMIAIFKAGALHVPLDPQHPPAKLQETITDRKIVKIVCSATAASNFASCASAQLVIIDSDALAESQHFPDQLPCADVTPHNAATILFTSGTTGKPKGVVLEHNAFATSCRDNSVGLRMTSESRVFQFASFTYDLSISDVFCTFSCGACLCVPCESDRLNDIPRAFSTLRVNHATLTPAVAGQLDPEDVPTLNTLVLGGEPLSGTLVHRWADLVTLINIYGITETCAWTTATQPIRSDDRTTSIGRAMCGRVWLVDVTDCRHLVPIGGIGEIIIEGPTLARHYLDNPMATEQAFVMVPDYIDPRLMIRVYRSGDLGQYTTDGNILCLGRRDAQVKISGQRVELHGIETSMKDHLPGNTETAAVVVRPTDRDPVLVGYIALDPSSIWSIEDMENIKSLLQQALHAVLPRYMVPSLLLDIPKLPVSSTGKLDRNLLARNAIEMIKAVDLQGSADPDAVLLTESEHRLQRLWAEVLNIDHTLVDRKSNFLHLGDSVAAMKLSKFARKTGFKLDVASILKHPVLVDMASVSDHSRFPNQDQSDNLLLKTVLPTNIVLSDVATSCQLSMDKIEDVNYCTPLQEGLMALSFKQPGAYVTQSVRRLRDTTDTAKFKAAWDTVAEMHNIMRTRLVGMNDQFLQVVSGEPIAWTHAQDLKDYLFLDWKQPMSLGDPLTRFALIKESDELIFVLTRHHATFDGYSEELIDTQHERIYFGEKVSRPPKFAKFIQHLTASSIDASVAWWEEELRDAQATNFPVNISNRRHDRADAMFQKDICFSRPDHMAVTTAILVRSAWALLTAKHSLADEVVFGTTLSGRAAPIEGIDLMSGPTITTVPVRVRITPTETVTSFLDRMQDQSIRMIPHEHFGLQNIRKLGEDMELACRFESLLVVNPQQETRDNLLYSNDCNDWNGMSRTFALSLQISLSPTGARVAVIYDSELLSDWYVTMLAGQLEYILQQLCDQPKCELHDLSYSSPQDQAQIESWVDAQIEVVDQCVHEIFHQRVMEAPNSLAVLSWDGSLTYAELDTYSTRLAHHLSGLGAGPEVVVPILYEKSMWTEVCLLAVIKAGGAFLLLDPGLSDSRLRVMISDVHAPLVLSSPTLEGMSRSLADIVCVVGPELVLHLPDVLSLPCPSIMPDNTLYIIFSSGTTGKPKGSALDHQAYASSARAMQRVLRLAPGTRALQFASHSFDACVEQLLATVLYGGTVCIPSDYERDNDLVAAINRMQVNFLRLTPSFARTLNATDIPTVKAVNLIGESMNQSDLEQWSHVQLYEGWGPSECTNSSGILDVTASGITDWTTRSIGLSATSSVQLYLVDPTDHNRLAPLGGLGEIVIDGANVAKGYINDVERTAQAFVERPPWLKKSACLPGRNLYKTGDLARHARDGTVIFVGRKDTTQIKIRGQRLELGEIEGQIQRFIPATTQVVVEAIVPNNSQDMVLVAFIHVSTISVHLSQTSPDMISADFAKTDRWATIVNSIETALVQVVPRFMIPSFWVPLSFIPSLGSNKIDRRAMKACGSGLNLDQLAMYTGVQASMRPPKTQIEFRLRKLWSDMLGVGPDHIGLDHSWFRLGGNSIDAMRLVATARKSGLLLTVVDIFQHPRLEHMASAAVLENDVMSVESLPLETVQSFSLMGDVADVHTMKLDIAQTCDITTEQIEDMYPCTPLQQGLMAISVKTPGREMAQFTFDIPPEVDYDSLRAAWESVARIAPLLRTRIVETVKATVQVVVDEGLEWTEGQSLEHYLQEDRCHFMTLGRRLCRLALIDDASTGTKYLCLSIHHAIYDGWSLRLIIDGVGEAYHGRIKEVSSTPFNVFLAHLQGQDESNAFDFWATQLAESHAEIFPRLPTAAYTPTADSFVEKSVELDDRHSTTDFAMAAIIQGAWAFVLAAHTANDDVVFGSTVHGRNVAIPSIESMMGPTFTTVPVRLQIDSTLSVRDYLRYVQQSMIKSVDFEHFGLQNIRDINESTRKACCFQNVLVVQSGDVSGLSKGLLGPRESRDDPSSLNSYGLMLDVKPSKRKIDFAVSYDSNLIDSVKMRRILDQTAYLLQRLLLISNAEQTISSIGILSPEDTQQIAHWNTSWPRTIYECIHDVIKIQALQRPQNEAVSAWDGSLSYLELDRLSSRLASHLVSLGAQAKQVLALCFDKSMWTVVAILAVMKSGAAFVLLDPAHHPMKRMKDAIDAAQSTVLLCSPTYCRTFDGTVDSVVAVSRHEIESLPEQYVDRRESSSPDDTLCILFTSGSTGMPKGIVHNHEGFASSFAAFGPALGIDSNTRLLQFSAYAFDACVGDILAPLMHGGCVCIPSEDQRMNDITSAINMLRANWALLTPSFARSLCPSEIPGLMTVLLGGEAILPSDELHWSDRTLLTGYGPAESSLCMAAAIGDSVGRHAPNLGWPVSCRTWITDVKDHKKLAPIGVGGHLIVEGPVNAAGGYLNDPEKTAASFISRHNWIEEVQSPVPQRFFKTGDLVRYASDGSLIFMGRLDTQIKLHGQRVEVDEVEFHLEVALSERALAGTKIESAVAMTTLPGSSNKTALAIFVGQPSWCEWTPEVGRTLSELLTHLQQYLAQQLPSYMVPSLIIPLVKLPLTVSEKLDRRQLSKFASEIPEDKLASYTRTSSIGVSPSNDMEKQLLNMFAEVLECDPAKIFADDTLLRLGGDSISAMRLVALARAQGLTLSVADIFNHGSPKELASLVAKASENVDRDPFPFSAFKQVRIQAIIQEAKDRYDIPPSVIQDVLPCTALQAGLMSLTTIRRGTYVAENIFELPEIVDLNRLRSSWSRLVQRNSILRTRIIELDEAFYQMILDEEAKIPLVHASLEDMPSAEMGLGLSLNQFTIIVNNSTNERHFIWYSHHSTYDGWSVRLLLDQFEKIYAGENPVPLPGFNRFTESLSKDKDASINFWKAEVDNIDIVAFPALPHISTQPSGTSKLTAQVDLSRVSHSTATMSTLIRAAWAIVLNHWCPKFSTPSIGIVLAGRAGAVQGIDRIAGPTLTTVPVVIPVRRAEKVAFFLTRVQQQAIDMLPYEQLGLQNIARLSEACKQATQFQTLLAIQPLETYDISSDKSMRLLPSGEQDSAFYTYGLTLQCFLHGGGFDLKVNFDSTMIEEIDVIRLTQQFDYVIHQLVADDDEKTVENIEMLSPIQKLEILQSNSASLQDGTERMTTHEKIIQIAALNPQSAAVQSGDIDLTYAELVNLSSKLAGHLQSLGIRPSTIVPLCFEKSPWALISQLAVLLAGGAFVSIDPSYPASRIEQILDQIDDAPLLLSAQTEHLFKNFGKMTMRVSADTVLKLKPRYFQAPSVRRSDLMYVIYTSGSTGQPKGVMIEHGAFDVSSSRYGPAIGLDEKSRVLQFASYVFDASVLETFTTLSLGGCVCVPSETDRTADLASFICHQNVNWALLTPSVLRLLEPTSVPSLKTLAVGAEAVGKEIIQTWLHYVKLHQVYGPAEASIICTTADIKSIDEDPRVIGRPPNCHAWIVDPDDHTRLSGLGLIGELVIQGPTLSRGYLADQQKTDAAFFTDPPWVATIADDKIRYNRFYKTGDLVRYASNGLLTFMGRKDSQVKINGQRVEIGEVEHQIRVILNEPVDVTVELIEDPSDGSPARLGAAISFKPTKAFTDQVIHGKLTRLRAELKAVLPSHMIPSLLLPLEHSPLNYAGKTDRRQIKSLLQAAQLNHSRSIQTPPSTQQELKLQLLWARILGCEASTISVEDDFFSRGDSISAIRLASAVREAGMQLSVADIFQRREFSAIACGLEQPRTRADTHVETSSLLNGSTPSVLQHVETSYSIDRDNIEAVYPCLGTQEFLMRESIANPGSNVMRITYALDEAIDLKLFKKSWEHVITSTEILRTRIVETVDAELVQVLLRSELAWQDTDDLKAYLDQDMDCQLQPGVPLTRYSLVHGDQATFFVWTIHHALYDGWSLPLLLSRVEDTYLSLTSNKPVDLAHASLRDLVEHQMGKDTVVDAQFWRSELHGAAASSYPCKKRMSLPHATETLQRSIPEPKSSQAPEYALANLIRAAWAVVLAERSNTTSVTYGTFLAGRTVPVANIERLIGPVSAKLPVHMRIDKHMSITSLLNSTREQAMRLLPRDHMGMHQIAELNASCADSCDFQTMLVIHPPETNGIFESLIGMKKLHVSGHHPHELVVEAALGSDDQGQVLLQASWDERVLSITQVEELLGRMERLITLLSTVKLSNKRVCDILAL